MKEIDYTKIIYELYKKQINFIFNLPIFRLKEKSNDGIEEAGSIYVNGQKNNFEL